MAKLVRNVGDKEEAAGSNGKGCNACPRPLRDYAIPNIEGATSSIARISIQANNIKIKPSLIQMLQTHDIFGDGPNEDPYTHLTNFEEVIDIFKYNGVHPDCI
ncbi:hypothetical protein ACH5RR_037176 [Cinchona calisaya]|uniref:Uncharacterized protein n=1 Tax=Cinchona calisaya TaxID=153742 RepID=A0ABD2YA28_9GENT